jgi:hypothetical protein
MSIPPLQMLLLANIALWPTYSDLAHIGTHNQRDTNIKKHWKDVRKPQIPFMTNKAHAHSHYTSIHTSAGCNDCQRQQPISPLLRPRKDVFHLKFQLVHAGSFLGGG